MVDQGKHKLFEDLGPTANVSGNWIYFHTEYNYVLYVCTMSMRKIQNRNFRAFSASLQIAQQSKPKYCVWKQEDKYEWLREYFFYPPFLSLSSMTLINVATFAAATWQTKWLPDCLDWLTDWLIDSNRLSVNNIWLASGKCCKCISSGVQKNDFVNTSNCRNFWQKRMHM